ncbi:4'-phosphopantetheinyl transferase superfamily protein [Mycoplasma enhydrae]|uniref:4'-phosphopantetheinyl transferase superfamily protein n=1 Tax=Mycoplasma enhydrae TaxID=2499220 RepID=UPI00197C5551|nr:4'-phosphopantetheinyl transferase superfamily protein [Mycoplasma enhydrae]MBN4089432.1 4'-phosphopantetheinyl transferase superfamily protein [Mycoplasma enhydrae]MCV3733488.1 4'-phosphopantetheinyl transferase superfamily protein [Mycoplasma enhydrae]MCV3753264.1 4'-phosphopantetheinyl transferase superfamily protein [Mycoplasma enhydrae]
MISVDLSKIRRFKKMSKRAINRILHPKEIFEFELLDKQKQMLFLATRWAIKECLFKIDNSLFEYNKIQITKTKAGKYIYDDFQLSTTNEDGYVVAVALKLS